MANENTREIKVNLVLNDNDYVSKLKKDAAASDKFIEHVSGNYEAFSARQQEMVSRFAGNFAGVGKGSDAMREMFARHMENMAEVASSKNLQFSSSAQISARVFEAAGPSDFEKQLQAREDEFARLQSIAEANRSHLTGATGSASSMLQEDQTRSAEKFRESLEGISKAFAKCTSAAAAFAKMTPFPSMLQSLKNLSKPLKDFGRVFKRVLLYKTIRGGIGAIIRGWREGLQNLYHYSQTFGTQFHNTMDSLATDAQMLKNGFAAMVAPLINAVGPVISAIAQRVVDLANAIGYFFAKILGQGSFSAAIRGSATAFKEMGGAAKEAKKQLMGFDELNVLTLPSSGGGGAGADYSKMFEEWDTALAEGSIEQRLRDAIENAQWEQVGQLLAEKMNGLVKNFKESEFGSNLGTRIQKGLSIAHGFMTRFDFKNAGSALAVNLNQAIGKIKWEDLGSTLARIITAAVDFLVGFIEDFDSEKAANALGDLIKGWFNHFTEWLTDGHIKWDEFGQTFFQKVYGFVTGIDFAGIASSFFTALGSAINAAWQVLEGFLSGMWEKWNEYCGVEADDSGAETIGKWLEGIWKGMVGIVKWVYDNIVKPFFNALRGKDGLGLDDGENGMETAGEDAMDALLDGLMNGLPAVVKFIGNLGKGIYETFKNWEAQSKRAEEWSSVPAFDPSPSMDGVLQKGGRIKKFMAEGGTVPTGQLFIANEAGPELVGSVGGKTTVTSQDQFTAGMADIMDVTNTVILQAAQSLMQTIQNKNMTAVAVIGDRDVVRSYDRGKTLAGGSLVE